MVIKTAQLHKSGVCQHHYSELPACASVYEQVTGICNYLLIEGTYTRHINAKRNCFYFKNNLFMRKNSYFHGNVVGEFKIIAFSIYNKL